jgi:hypothetical protein
VPVLARRIDPATFRSSETVDRHDQRSCQAEYRDNDAGDRKADHLAASLMRAKDMSSVSMNRRYRRNPSIANPAPKSAKQTPRTT